MIVRKPDHVSWVQAAAVMENWLTAFQGTVLSLFLPTLRNTRLTFEIVENL